MILLDYLYWHYFSAPLGILGLLRNYLIGTWHKFLINIHFKTLFSPWHRLNPSDVGEVKNFGDRILNFIVDFYIRIIAMIIRLTVILTGLMCEIILIFLFFVLFIVWFFWPIILIFFINKGFSLL
jgi:hypothetical protein